jgi:16S rRNA (guanine1207-N2)-methyltransferase
MTESKPSSVTLDPWYKTTLHFKSAAVDLTLHVPHEVFSTQRIDEGTLLLLDHLANTEPKTILDMGCGYGALGLPIAARFPEAKIEMVDRDLLAVKWSALNAAENKLSGVNAVGSLGFRDLEKSATYDWILCNVPARIGRPFIQNLVQEGRARLTAKGDLRLVVINDLMPLLLELSSFHEWPMHEVVRGARHTVVSFSSLAQTSVEAAKAVTSEELYFRDRVEVNGMSLVRPFDLGGDDPKRLKSGLPVLFDMLPRDPRHQFKNILCFRSGYGVLPLTCRRRHGSLRLIVIYWRRLLLLKMRPRLISMAQI